MFALGYGASSGGILGCAISFAGEKSRNAMSTCRVTECKTQRTTGSAAPIMSTPSTTNSFFCFAVAPGDGCHDPVSRTAVPVVKLLQTHGQRKTETSDGGSLLTSGLVRVSGWLAKA